MLWNNIIFIIQALFSRFLKLCILYHNNQDATFFYLNYSNTPYNSVSISLPGNVIEAVRHARCIRREIALARSMDETELFSYAKQLQVPHDLLVKTAKMGRLPVVNFAAGGLGKLLSCYILSYCTMCIYCTITL